MIPKLIVTSFPDKHADTHGAVFQKSYYRLGWDRVAPLLVVRDADIVRNPANAEFLARANAERATANRADIHRGVAKWANKVFALTVPEVLNQDGWVLWFDADVEFTGQPFPEIWDTLCPPGADVTFLGRPWAYASETGFVGYNLASGKAKRLLLDMRSTYLTDGFRQLDEWGDAAVFDQCRSLQALAENDLCEGIDGPDLHVWPKTVLRMVAAHHKGPARKEKAYRREKAK